MSTPLVPPDGAAQLPDGIVGDLLAYGRDESNQARIAKDRNMYQFYQGWCAALERVKAISPDGAAAALKALVETWRAQAEVAEQRKQAASDKNYLPGQDINRAKMLTYRECADELETVLAALPEARLPAEKTPEQLQHDLVYLLAHTQRERDTAVERYQLAEAKLNALPEARRQEDDAVTRGAGTGNSTVLQSAAPTDDGSK